MKSVQRVYRILTVFIYAGCFLSGITVHAEASAVFAPDIGCYEYGYGSHERQTPPPAGEILDPAVYGENNISFIYVSVYGDDSNGSGTLEAPYASVHQAASIAVPGDTIKVGAGVFVFTEPAYIPVGVSLEGEGEDTIFTSDSLTRTDIGGGIALVQLHSEENPKAYGNQHISHITFDGQQKAAWAIDIANRHNVSVHDCRIVNFCETGVGWHATDLSRLSIEDTNPDISAVNGTFVTGGRFYCNYLRDNTRFADGWGRGSLFICGLSDFAIYDNIMIEDVRTSPTGTRGVPLKAWYYSGWMRNIRIHGNDIRRLGSASHSSDGSGWDFAIEIAAPYTGLEISYNHFTGSVDLNGGFTAMDGIVYDFSAWIHHNTFTADPEPRYDNGIPFCNEEYAFTLERLTQKTIIEYNTVTGYDTVVYFNGREEISDITFRYNLCTELGGQGGSMFRLDGMTSPGFADHIAVKDLFICNNVFSSINGDGASGFGIILGQEMGCSWSLENVEVSNNVVDGCIYPYWFAVENSPTSITGLRVESNIVHGESGMDVRAFDITDFVCTDNLILNDTEWSAVFEDDWYPKKDSPAIDNGKRIKPGALDLAGNPVPY